LGSNRQLKIYCFISGTILNIFIFLNIDRVQTVQKQFYLKHIFIVLKRYMGSFYKKTILFVLYFLYFRTYDLEIFKVVDRGGLNLMNPGIKAKTLFITNFLKQSTNNPFIMQFLSTNNPPFLHSMPNISNVKFFLLEISYIPNEQITSY
jgi:hypothetical protein